MRCGSILRFWRRSRKAYILRALDIKKYFAGVKALDGVSLEIRPGEIHCLAGENGCGKSTQAALLADAIQAAGREVVRLREPGGTSISEKIRALVLDPDNAEMAPECELLLFEASRAQLVRQVIEPALAHGDVVLCDRFYDSTYAYQAAGRALDARVISQANALGSCGVTPDLTLLLDMDTEFRGEKVQTQTQGVISGVEGMLSPLNGLAYEGYEIHMGRSRQEMPALSGGGNVYGSYVHGIFDAPGIADTILRTLCAKKGVSFDALATFDTRGYKERQYDLLADVVRGGLDMSFVYRVLRREV